MSLNFYSVSCMDQLENTAVTSEATGFEIENAMDWNLNTYWKPTSTANQTIRFDLQSAFSLTGCGLWIHNYNTIHGPDGDPDLAVDYSDNDVDWSSFMSATGFISFEAGTYMNDGLLLVKGLPAASHQYWRFVFSDMATTIEISQFFLLGTHAITQNSNYPRMEPKTYANQSSILRNRRRLASAGNSTTVTSFNRTWRLFDSSIKDALEAAYDGSFGDLLPIIIEESAGAQKLVYILSPTFNAIEREYEVWDLTLNFSDVPFVPDGSAF